MRIAVPKSIIPACDVDLPRFREIVQSTSDIQLIGAYKIGFSLVMRYGLPTVVEVARDLTDKPLIYDHQKAGTDIPMTGGTFMRVAAEAGIDAVILFPQAGPATLASWTRQAIDRGLGVIVGGKMTHERYVVSEGGYIADDAVVRIYMDAAGLGVTDFVVPGNQPDFVARIREHLAETVSHASYYAPGFIEQGGSLSSAARAAGPRFHAIVGRAIYEAESIRNVALHLTEALS